MRRMLMLAALVAAVIAGVWKAQAAEERVRYEMAYGDTVRTYTMYLPQGLPQGAPLVVYTHGYGSKTRWRPDLNAVADTALFAVCYPDGAPDTRGKDGWWVGYPPQSNMAHNEEDFFRALLDEVCARWGLSRENVFMAGMSNGGDLCYQLAYICPDLFRAYASVAGLTFEWVYRDHALTIPVPFMEIHGNADRTSRWDGDHAGAGGWGEYIPVPLAVSAIAANNRCMTMTTDSFPTLQDADRMVIRTRWADAPSGCDVELYEVQGAPHSWHAKDVPTGRLAWEFFSRYIR